MPSTKPLIRDETLRDGNQGEVPRSAFQAIQHIVKAHQWYDMMSIGWIYTNPADKEAAQYLRDHRAELQSRPEFSDLTKDKFFVYTLMHRTDKAGGLKLTPDQSAMLEDMRNDTQPFGHVNVLSKARVADIKDLGYSNPEDCARDLDQTMQRLHDANPNVKLELALEHIYTAWLESTDNHEHIVKMIVTALGHDEHMRITAPDTDGAHAPEDIKFVLGELTQAVQEFVPSFSTAQFTVHAHKDRGFVENEQGETCEQSVANVQAALEAGAGAVDCCAGRMGERRGNVTLADVAMALDWSDKEKVAAYQHGFEQSLGIHEDDKPVGGAESMCGVGGMHAARLWNDFIRQRKETHVDDQCFPLRKVAGWVDYDEFVSAPRGSYASVPPDIFVPKQKLQVTLSPVAGGSNVQHMLARLGMVVEDKADPRVQSVLTAVKEGEHERAEHFRGYNNVNAMLLVADAFELRKKTNRPAAAMPPAHAWEGGLDQQAGTALQEAVKPWRTACRGLDDIEIMQTDQVTMYKGKLSAQTLPMWLNRSSQNASP